MGGGTERRPGDLLAGRKEDRVERRGGIKRKKRVRGEPKFLQRFTCIGAELKKQIQVWGGPKHTGRTARLGRGKVEKKTRAQKEGLITALGRASRGGNNRVYLLKKEMNGRRQVHSQERGHTLLGG